MFPMVPSGTSQPALACHGQQVIDRDGPTPLYIQVADVIEARIKAGDLLPDRPVPSENQLVQEFDIARGTARKTIDLLRERGLIVTVVGRGSFVKARPST
jgi:GntR family transcriptional regulator